MLQTADFLKFLEELFLKHNNRVFDRVAQCRNFFYYFTKK